MARIIVAEDEEIISSILQAKLISAGHAVGVLADGRDALRVIRDRLPDAVVLDCNMPGMPGIAVLQELRKSPRTWDIPVMMLTGRTSSSDRSLAMYAGANSYATKPFDPEDIVIRLERMLESQPPVSSPYGHA